MRPVSPTSTSGAARQLVERAQPGTFFRRADFAGTGEAIDSALSRLAGEGELVRVRKGLYWRGKHTRFGMTRPSTLETALAVAGPGSGPAGVAAAQLLGLTTQVPATIEVAVPGKAPSPLRGVRFRSRPYSRRDRHLSATEVAVLEVLRDPKVAELSLAEISERIRELAAKGTIRADLVGAAAADEPRVEARARWAALAA